MYVAGVRFKSTRNFIERQFEKTETTTATTTANTFTHISFNNYIQSCINN